MKLKNGLKAVRFWQANRQMYESISFLAAADRFVFPRRAVPTQEKLLFLRQVVFGSSRPFCIS